MNIKFKILIVIVSTIAIYAILNVGISQTNLCDNDAVKEDFSACYFLYEIRNLTIIHIIVPYGDIGAGSVSDTGEDEPQYTIDYSWLLYKNLGFVLAYIMVPSVLIAIIYWRNRVARVSNGIQ